MTRYNIKTMTLSDLVERFAAIALDQDKAIFDEDNANFNRLYYQMEKVSNELESRPGDQRTALMPLYIHPSAQVRLRAAIATLKIAPAAAREVLQKLANSPRFPNQAADALFILRRLDGVSLVRN